MKIKFLATFTLAIFLGVFCNNSTVLGQTAKVEDKSALLKSDGAGVKWEMKVPFSTAVLTVSSPDGAVKRRDFSTGSVIDFTADNLDLPTLPDGQYNYELRFIPADKSVPLVTRQIGDPNADGNQSSQRVNSDSIESVQSGSFAVLNGRIYTGNSRETVEKQKSKITAESFQTPQVPSREILPNDVVTADDAIIQGSACIGIDCVNNESFGFDTVRLKENNTRLTFIDTSASAGFAGRDWRLRANESSSGGRNAFFIDDLGDNGGDGTETALSTPFTILAGAPTNSFVMDSSGRIGLRTSTPALDLHINTGNTPAIRLEQNNGSGFTAQTWDIGANEANFFIRDLTAGSRLPFRIRPGAPTSSLDIGADGLVTFSKGIKIAPLDNNGVPTGNAVDQTALLSPLGPNFATHLMGASGTVDESSTAVADLDNVTGAGIKPGLSGSNQATIRYNVVPNQNFVAGGGMQTVYVIRYRDSDGGGTAARVIVILHRTNITNGTDTTTQILNSNTKAATGSGFASETVCVADSSPISFATQSIWFEVRVATSTPTDQANLSQIQMYRGLTCP